MAPSTPLLAQSELTGQQVKDALKNEEAHRLGVAAAAATTTSTILNSAAPALSICMFCHNNGHSVEHCFKFEEYSKKAWEEVKEASSNNSNSNSQKQHNHKDNKGKANAAQENQPPTESAGVASI